MKQPLLPSNISTADFNTLLEQYDSVVPEDLRDLDAARWETIPAAVAARKRKDGEAWLAKKELEELVSWKLKHGTFRPALLARARANPADSVRDTTRDAFTLLSNDSIIAVDTILSALKTLTTLNGIGPATASLLLSVGSGGRVPFFSDEVFLWVTWDEGGTLAPIEDDEGGVVRKGVGSGWKRKIGYTNKEYRIVCERVAALRERLREDGEEVEVSAGDVEKVAWAVRRVEEGEEKGGERNVEAEKKVKGAKATGKPATEKVTTQKDKEKAANPKRKATEVSESLRETRGSKMRKARSGLHE